MCVLEKMEDALCPVTVILTTSPTHSNPSTELINAVLVSFRLVSGLKSATILIVADGCVVHDKSRWKSGWVTPEQRIAYNMYLDNLQKELDNPFTSLLRLPTRVGFGFAVKTALAHVTTPYVLVVQHDYSFVRPISLAPVLAAMEMFPDVLKYVAFVSTSTYEYALRRGIQYVQWGVRTEVVTLAGEPFCKLLFWYDKTHLARTDFYRSFVFGVNSCVRRGDFPEYRLGHVMTADIKANGMAAHATYGTFLWYPNGGTETVIRHSNGRGFLTVVQKTEAEATSRNCVCKDIVCLIKDGRRHHPSPPQDSVRKEKKANKHDS